MASKQKKTVTSSNSKVIKPKIQLATQKPVINFKKPAQNKKLKTTKVKEKGRATVSKAGYALYSSESEEQATAVRRDVDRCARLLSQLAQEKYGGKSHNDGKYPVNRILSDVNAPYNSRITSSTPDPDKLLDNHNMFQVIPERDCTTSTINANGDDPPLLEKQMIKPKPASYGFSSVSRSHDQYRHSGVLRSHDQYRQSSVQEDLRSHDQYRQGDVQEDLRSHDQYRQSGVQEDLRSHDQYRQSGVQEDLRSHDQYRQSGVQEDLRSHDQYRQSSVQKDLRNIHAVYSESGNEIARHNSNVDTNQFFDRIRINGHPDFNIEPNRLQATCDNPSQNSLPRDFNNYASRKPQNIIDSRTNSINGSFPYEADRRLSDVAGMDHFLHRESEEFVPFQGYRTGSLDLENQHFVNEQRLASSLASDQLQQRPEAKKNQLSKYMFDQLASLDSSVREHIIQALREKDISVGTNKSHNLSVPSNQSRNDFLAQDQQLCHKSLGFVPTHAQKSPQQCYGVDRFEVPEQDTSREAHKKPGGPSAETLVMHSDIRPEASFKETDASNGMQSVSIVSPRNEGDENKTRTDGQTQSDAPSAIVYHCCKCANAQTLSTLSQRQDENLMHDKAPSHNDSSKCDSQPSGNTTAIQNTCNVKCTSFTNSNKSTHSQETQTHDSSVSHLSEKESEMEGDGCAGDVNVLPKQFHCLLGGFSQLKCLLKQVKDLMKISKDANVKKLCREIDKTLKNVPQLKDHFNLNAEIGLLLQPLRSENADLRRKLRILNQHLKELELEKMEKEKTDHGGFNFEMVHLQTTNAYLQKQIKEEQDNKVKLSKQINEMKGEISQLKLEKQHLAVQLSQEDTEKMKLKETCQGEMLRLQRQLEILSREVGEIQSQWKSSEQENSILHITLKQRDSEINKLQRQIDQLKSRMSDVVHELQQNTNSSDKPVLLNASSSLRKILKELNENRVERSQSPTRSVMSDPGTESVDHRHKPSHRQNGFRYDIDSLVSPRSLTADAIAQHDKHSKLSTGMRKKELFRELDTSTEMSYEISQILRNKHPDRQCVQQGSKKSQVVDEAWNRPLKTFDSRDKIGGKKVESEVDIYRNGVERIHGNRKNDLLNQTRYSLTDYFKKFNHNSTDDSNKDYTSNPRSSEMPHQKHPYMQSNGVSDEISDTEVSLSSSKQDDHYRGTELDLSLSTIDDDKMSSITSLITRTSVSTAVTVDDRAFRRGIEILDSNIAKVQDSLRKTRQMFT